MLNQNKLIPSMIEVERFQSEGSWKSMLKKRQGVPSLLENIQLDGGMMILPEKKFAKSKKVS